MINHAVARAGLKDVLDEYAETVPGLQVQRAGVDAVAMFPSLIIGQPRWRPEDNTPYRTDRSTWPIAVVVARGASDSAVIDQLEELWPAVVDHLRDKTRTDRTLGGICSESLVTSADFGQFAVQGTNYPAQLILLDLYG